METAVQWLNQIGIFPPAIALLVGILRWRALSHAGKWLTLMCLISLITEIVSHWAATQWGNNMAIFHVYVPLEFSIFCLIFHFAYPKVIPRTALIIALSSFWILALVNVRWIQPWNTYMSVTRTTEAVAIIGLTIRFFYLVLHDLEIPELHKTFIFWFSTACLLYFSTNLLLFIYSNYVITGASQEFWEVFAIHAVLNILLYFVYAIALLCRPQARISARFF